MQHITVRKMEEQDVPKAVAVENENEAFPWSTHTFYDCLRVGYQGFVIEVEQEIVGFSYMDVRLGECHILNIAIKANMHHQGLGRRLMQHMLDLGRAQNATMAFLETRCSNATALHLYTSLGFNEIGVRQNYYRTRDGMEDAIVLAAELNLTDTTTQTDQSQH